VSEKSKLTLMSLLFNPRKGEDRIYEVDLGETFSCGQSNSMRMPYETVSVTTAGKSHGFVWAPYATIVDSRNQTIGRRYNPEMIQIRKRVDWIFSELRCGF
jgi:hypothetical protein